jgi:DNA-binding MarR family transcriptional regulator
VIRQLLDKKLIHVSLSQNDGRLRQYALTSEGKRKLENLRALRERAIDAIWMRLDPAALETFSDFSAQLVDHIEQYNKTTR